MQFYTELAWNTNVERGCLTVTEKIEKGRNFILYLIKIDP
jgi:hypothetical protein